MKMLQKRRYMPSVRPSSPFPIQESNDWQRTSTAHSPPTVECQPSPGGITAETVERVEEIEPSYEAFEASDVGVDKRSCRCFPPDMTLAGRFLL